MTRCLTSIVPCPAIAPLVVAATLGSCTMAAESSAYAEVSDSADTIEGVYLAALEFAHPWADFALADRELYILSRDPVTDLVTLVAHAVAVSPELLDRARELARPVTGAR